MSNHDSGMTAEVMGDAPPKINAAKPGHGLGWSAWRLTAFDIASDGGLSNRRVWAEGLGPDGICLDAGGAVWVQTPDTPRGSVVRIREGGEVLERIDHDRSILGTMLGGPEGRTLFLAAGEWRGPAQVAEAIAARTGQILMVDAPAPGAGWP